MKRETPFRGIRRVYNDKGSARERGPRTAQPAIGELLQTVVSRRRFSAAVLSSAALAGALPGALAGCGGIRRPRRGGGFAEVPFSATAEDLLPEGYSRQVLVRWGDPLFGDAPDFEPARQSRDAAERRFGYNNDHLAYLPIDPAAAGSDHGLLVVNHEYPQPWIMWDGLEEDTAASRMDEAQVDVSMAAVGLSVLEVVREQGQWRVVQSSRYNRRVSMFTPIEIRGPAAGHPRLRTSADPEGRTVLGTHDNCNGGVTPWGTVLSGEEGSGDFFSGDYTKSPDRELLERYYYDAQSDTGDYGWGRFHPRLNFEREPNEPNRFEWVVEIDPYDPESMPVKRTALGRFAHEGAHTVLNADGRIVVLMGDDWEFEYVYRFVSSGRYDPDDRAANKHLLDDGVLSVARFDDDGGLEWLPLVFGAAPLDEAHGFTDQGDLLVQTRRAADLVGATPMDAPEGFVSSPLSGSVYLALTQNRLRKAGQVNAANPRPDNEHGHLLELFPPRAGGGVDYAADRWHWSVFLLCGGAAEESLFHPETAPDSRFTDPDNLAVDNQGRVWVCTDEGHGARDALYVVETEGEQRGLSRRFYLPPLESECCSPAFTPDGRTLFLSVQHPGEEAKSLEHVVTRWPDAATGEPPRPSIIVITRDDGGIIGA